MYVFVYACMCACVLWCDGVVICLYLHMCLYACECTCTHSFLSACVFVYAHVNHFHVIAEYAKTNGLIFDDR